jgi:nicotinate-nucleotide adenylyltransferase
MTKNKIGIYSGSFDPVHLGHITFALQAIETANLAKVYFLPERLPLDKPYLEHFGHRVAMIKSAIKPHRKLDILEIEDRTFSVKKTLPKLLKKFESSELVFLFGSDKVKSMADWPDFNSLLNNSEILIGIRKGDSIEQITECTLRWPKSPLNVIFSYSPEIQSVDIRKSLENGEPASGLLKSVSAYIRKNWLYISFKKF